MNSYQRNRFQHAKIRQSLTVWVLALAPSVQTNPQLIFLAGSPTQEPHYLTDTPKHSAWYQSKHHANSALTPALKQAGFIATQTMTYK